MEPLYLVDGYGLFFRAYFAFAKSPMKNVHGTNISAVFGFYRAIHALFRTYKPTYFALVLDPAGPTFRNRLYPEYKATRQKTPDDLVAQFPVLEQVARALNLPVLRVEDYEADDILATLAGRCKETGRPCRIISADKDLMQLVDDLVLMLRPSRDGGFDLTGPAEVLADKGVGPEAMLDYLSLLGDSSDNVPGVRGIGEKGAAKLLAQWGSLDGIYAHIDEVSPPGIREKLVQGREMAYLSRDLIRLAMDVPGFENPDIEAWHVSRINGPQGAAWLRDEGLRVLARDWEAFGAKEAAPDEVADQGGSPGHNTVEEPRDDAAALVDTADPDEARPTPPSAYDPATQDYRLVTTLDGVRSMVEALRRDLATEPWLCFDTETEGLDVHQAALCGLSFSARAGTGWYLALRGPAEGEGDFSLGDPEPRTILAWEAVRPLVAPLLQDPAIRLVAQHAKFDWQVLLRHGLEPHGIAFDPMVAAWLCDSTRNTYNMDDLALDYLSYEPISFQSLFPPEQWTRGKKDPRAVRFSLVDLSRAAVYSAEDADITLRLAQALHPRIVALGLESLLADLEMPLIPILARMEYQGIGLDSASLASYGAELEQRLGRIEAELYDLVGHPFNINSTKQLQEVLFVERKLQTGKKTKTGYSTDISVLEELARQDPVPQKVLEHRSLAKLKSTYVDTLPTMVRAATGKVHTSYIQTGTATGRISSKDPNLQNIPVKDEDGRRIRMAFVTPPGEVFVSADYSQIELVVMAHLADDPGLKEAFRTGQDVHRLTASRLFHVPVDQVSSEQRRLAKTINFGVLYGMSAFRLSNELGIPNKEAAAFIDAYFTAYPGIKAFIAATVERCTEEGGIRTLLGRWRPIPAIRSANRNERQGAERVAVNTPIQGTAADIVKRAMLRMSAALQREGLRFRLILQVHDELIFQGPEAEQDRVMQLCREEMPRAIDLSVPLGISVEAARRWGDMHA